ncbi:MAG: hypothetical protein LBN95_13640 [Prevotellaceae bacterium]|jgi:hypothetical protein|nr:hypothetical protein [Prevotellaceae bacterium]
MKFVNHNLKIPMSECYVLRTHFVKYISFEGKLLRDRIEKCTDKEKDKKVQEYIKRLCVISEFYNLLNPIQKQTSILDILENSDAQPFEKKVPEKRYFCRVHYNMPQNKKEAYLQEFCNKYNQILVNSDLEKSNLRAEIFEALSLVNKEYKSATLELETCPDDFYIKLPMSEHIVVSVNFTKIKGDYE